MKKSILIILIIIIGSVFVKAQIQSGIYDNELKLAFNPSTGLITGVYENYSGYDESTGNPMFSCIFYIHGFLTDSVSDIETYYPIDKSDDLILGELQCLDKQEISIKLDDEHGGCWNVWNFSDDFTKFKVQDSKSWIEIRYVEIEKTYFYSDKKESAKRKAYLVKGDVVFIDKIESDWIFCTYYGKTITTGWLKLNSVNQN